MSSAKAHIQGAHFDIDKVQSCQVLQHPTHLPFFNLFINGLERHMGRDVRPNLGLDYQVLHVILRNLEEDLPSTALERTCKQNLLLIGFYLLVCFVGSLRGNKGFMMELQGLLQNLMKSKEGEKEMQHVVIPLLGEFKGKRGECWHLVPTADVTASGFRPQLWTE
eukprot:3510494-Ditylum_brightwellii.AAC.1